MTLDTDDAHLAVELRLLPVGLRRDEHVRRAPASFFRGRPQPKRRVVRRMASVAPAAPAIASGVDESMDGRNRENRAGSAVEQSLRDASEQSAGKRRMPARPDDDHVGIDAPRELGDGVGRSPGGAVEDVERDVDALGAGGLDLPADPRAQLVLVGEDGGTGAPASGEALVDVHADEPRPAARRELLRVLESAVGGLRSVRGPDDGPEHVQPPLSPRLSRPGAAAASASERSALRVSPDADRSPDADHRWVSYAVVWSENGGALRAGRLEFAGGSVRLCGSPVRELSYADLAAVRVDRHPTLRLAGRPTVVIESIAGDSFRVASLEGVGTLTELAERLQSALVT